jgi:hypothetical protein
MMNWMIARKKTGIKFTVGGNAVPYAMVDASNKPDPNDSKCQYGFNVTWMGGPIMATSKKLSHIGLSAAHNEYMAVHWCNRHVAWMRDLFREMGLMDLISEPTTVFGDNKTANELCSEDMVTKGNQHYRTPYHFNKEMVEEGYSEVVWIESAKNTADMMTKSVPRQVVDKLLMPLLGYE